MPINQQQTFAHNPKSSTSSNGKPTGRNTNGSSKPRGKSRYSKKKSGKKFVKPVVVRAAVKSYISACCSVAAKKPRCGQVESVQSPDSKKIVEQSKGLGHWRCGACNKPTKVTPRKPEPVEEAQYFPQQLVDSAVVVEAHA